MKPTLSLKYFFITLFLVITAFLFARCATPTQPTGGPPDQTPPQILRTEPANGTVNFDGDEIRFFFDKYVNRESFKSNFRIDPLVNIRYSLSWRGRSVRVQFDDPLPDSTTVIFTVGTGFSDTNRNRISSPFVLAISTGDRIDEGEIEGAILDGKTGKGKQDAFVFLYREPFDLEAQANYVAETDTSGQFRFSYLRSGRYKALWVDDRNRNFRWNRSSETARPFYREFVNVEDGRPARLGTLYVAEPDTVRPQLQGTGMFSSNRLRLRYSRDMVIEPDAEITILDSLDQVFTSAVPLFADKAQPNVVFAETLDPLPEEQRFRLRSTGLTDRHGNEPRISDRSFPGSSDPDTTLLRLIRHITEDGVPDTDPFVFEFSTFIDGTVVTDSLEVIQDETIFTEWEPVLAENNLLYVFPAPVWEAGSNYTIRIMDERSSSRQNIPVTFFATARQGSLLITVDENFREEGVMHFVELTDARGNIAFSGSTDHEILVDKLFPGKYILRAFRDDEGTGSWFRGSADPFKAPGLKHIERGIEIHSRMEGSFLLRYEAAGLRTSSLPQTNDSTEGDIHEVPLQNEIEPDPEPGEND
ncbi:MAG: Ig-like domain-containing protein [Balneolales bacterium]|nr:Ig-like domain-containing protein [Balneolales bacterium]